MKHRVDPRANALRLTLLASLGLLPVACGGATSGRGGGGSGGGGFPGSTAGVSPGKPGQTADGVACTNPVVDPASGLVSCAEGYTHRPAAQACGENLTGPGESPSEQRALPRLKNYAPCDADPGICGQYQFGYCLSALGGSVCVSGCAEDADCGVGSLCLCTNSTGYGVCEPGTCQDDTACEPGFYCADYLGACGSGWACQTPDDTCFSGDECQGGEGCSPNDMGVRTCVTPCVVGRPFLVAAEARVAPLVAGNAWCGRARTPRVDHLSPEQRNALAAHWSRLGQLEHASIAAFARFSLQLLALGAPAELVEACTRALADETAHTQLCFGLASAYAGRPLGPGPLQITDCLAAVWFEEIVDLVLEEGCFGETRAAFEAQRDADDARDPVIQQAYSQIARDETRHAELAFKFVGWALQQDYAATRARIVTALAQRDTSAGEPVDDVTVPCLEALLFANQAA